MGNRLLAFARDDQILENEPMARHTTFRVGGRAELVFLPETEEELVRALESARAAGVETYVVGCGSNLIVRDGGVRGLVVLTARLNALRFDGARAWAGAGLPLPELSRAALARGLSGLEFACGIPGSVGGGAAMNAGAYGGQLSDCLARERVLIGDRVEILEGEQMALGYRTSRALQEGGVILEAEFLLAPDEKTRILARMNDLNRRRREKQPLSYPSAGSVFKRPEGHFAGALIEEAGLKGEREGGAAVSELHAGFIVNLGGATARDVLTLIERVRARVFERSGVTLEPEVRVIGEG